MFKDEYAQNYVKGLYEFYINQSTDKNYGAKSFDYILNVEHRPNKTAVLLAIPMYMYRIETKVWSMV